MIFTDRVLSDRRHRVAATLPLGDALLLVGAGEPVPLPENSDQTSPFRAHAEYVYLAGLDHEGGVIAYDPRDRGWTSFVPIVTEAARVWEGRTQLPGIPLTELPAWLAARSGRAVAALGAPLAGVTADASLSGVMRAHFHHARRPKDDAELALLRRAATATAAGYAAVQAELRPGRTERQLQIELEAAFFRAGGDRPGYGSIVGSGPNAAVLHVDPSDRAFGPGEFVLIDAGAEVSRYVCDVTRTYVVGDAPTPFQRDLYQIVLSAQQRAIAACRPGEEWKEIHLRCAVDLTAGLIELGVMHGAAESLVEQEAHTLFFPHGLGHLVGLGVRDASGTLPDRPKDPRPCLRTLRTDLPLAPGYVITVEPGLYFIPALLNDPVRRERFRDCVNWAIAEQHLGIGGVRIEDNLVITTGEPENLTAAIPRML
jgi:Xaa-Pro aminopeptidase